MDKENLHMYYGVVYDRAGSFWKFYEIAFTPMKVPGDNPFLLHAVSLRPRYTVRVHRSHQWPGYCCERRSEIRRFYACRPSKDGQIVFSHTYVLPAGCPIVARRENRMLWPRRCPVKQALYPKKSELNEPTLGWRKTEQGDYWQPIFRKTITSRSILRPHGRLLGPSILPRGPHMVEAIEASAALLLGTRLAAWKASRRSNWSTQDPEYYWSSWTSTAWISPACFPSR